MTTSNKQPATNNRQPTSPTIGVFDSGFGGLTVLRALLPLIPGANYIYLGDTARLPYGSKSRETIARYAVSSAKFLHEQGAELLVIACNTATALALEDIQQALPIPVIGVVEPGAQAALAIGKEIEPPQNRGPQRAPLLVGVENRVPHLRDSLIVAKVGEVPRHSATKNNTVIPSEAPERAAGESNGAQSRNPRISPESPPISPRPHVLVLATQATVQSHAYTRALNTLHMEATEKACPLLVPLVEEGWINHPVTDDVLKIYLTEALAEAPATSILLLGCTHYPLLEPAIRRALIALHHPLTIIDSAQATAEAVASHLHAILDNLQPATSNLQPAIAFYATDSVEKFQRLGSAFLSQPVTEVRHIDLRE
jgi:glutamate racemase